MAANEQGSLRLSCRSDPLRLGLRRPRVADGFGGQDQAPPDCGSVTPERVERRVLVVPVFQARKCRLVDPTTPGHLGHGESRRLAGPLDLLHERAQLAILAVEIEVRRFAGGNQLFGGGVPVSEHVSDGPMACPVFRSPLDLGANLVSFLVVSHRFCLRSLDRGRVPLAGTLGGCAADGTFVARGEVAVFLAAFSSTAPDRSASRMQTMPGKSLATSLKRKRRAFNDMHFRTPFACASGL